MSTASAPEKKKKEDEKKPQSKARRITFRILRGLLWTLLGLILFILFGGLGPTVKYIAAPVARSIGIPLSVDTCVILPVCGYVNIEGLQIDNPEAFVKSDPDVYGKNPLLRVGTLKADLAVLTLFSEEIRVDTVELSGLRVLYAYDLDTTNVDALLAALPSGGEAEEPVEEPAEEPGEPIKLKLAKVTFDDNEVTIRKFISVPIPLPPYSATDVDNRTLVEKVDTMIAPVITAIKAGGEGIGSGVKMIGDGAATVTDGAAEIGADAVDAGKAVLGEGAKTVEEGAKAIGDGLKSLFGD